MDAVLKEGYYQAKEIYIAELTRIKSAIDAFAEKNGGADALDEKNSRIVSARNDSLLKLIEMHDRTQEYIESMEQVIHDLTREKKELAWLLGNDEPKKEALKKEMERGANLVAAQQKWPELYERWQPSTQYYRMVKGGGIEPITLPKQSAS